MPFYFIAALLSLLQLCYSQNECFIEGIPENTLNKDNIYFSQLKEKPAQISLACYCSVYTPKWQTLEMDTWINTLYTYPVKCVDNDHECNPKDITYISPINKSNGLYVFLNRTFTITETTVLMCFSSVEREVVIISLQEPISHTISLSSSSSSSLSLSITSSLIPSIHLSKTSKGSLSETSFRTSSPSSFSSLSSSSTLIPSIHLSKTSMVSLSDTSINTSSSPGYSLSSSIPETSSLTRPLIHSRSLSETSLISKLTLIKTSNTITTSIFVTTRELQQTPELTNDRNIQDKILNTVGTPSLVIVPILIIVMVISIVLCTCIICLKVKHEKKIKDMGNEIKMLTIKRRSSVNTSENRSSLTQIISGSESLLGYHWNHVNKIRSEQSLSSLPHSIQRDSSINTTTVCISV